MGDIGIRLAKNVRHSPLISQNPDVVGLTGVQQLVQPHGFGPEEKNSSTQEKQGQRERKAFQHESQVLLELAWTLHPLDSRAPSPIQRTSV
jgi:hypothetical protein